MCIITFHIQAHPVYKLILIANRDEQYARPTERAHFWEDAPELFAGRDLVAQGTWMGITKQGRFAALTNYRNPSEKSIATSSRGHIVSSYLKGHDKPTDFLDQLQRNRKEYDGFNLLVGSPDTLYFYNKQENQTTIIKPGTYSVSNASLNTPWPKVEKARTRLKDYVTKNEKIDSEILFQQLYDDVHANNDQLPDTGVGHTLEKQLSPIFIRTPNYGTRSSSVLLVTHDDEVTFLERTFNKGDAHSPTIEEHFQIKR